MNLASITSTFFILCLFTSCLKKSPLDKYTVGQCFKEVHNNYASYAKSEERIYRIEGITESNLKISTWYDRYWIYQGEKDPTYFNNRSIFTYSKTPCPGSRANASIADKIQGIDLKNQ
ncbi:putative membrane protein [Halobacteriovorax marinus SJ]|uniref:Membrane protein n=1 Tax=Halobacteriovorax marinus (strain ATCC BAA-682 / DSM 15412 / SJ) TaxID=862908 RepID=E1WZK6_HALMS|nr:hypothetical protein [Halobacteriovorax marinus]CBW26192.1 putative membrane protein [Halobacteriovorax marinus SJ]